MSITVNSKVFNETSSPGPTSRILTTFGRGITLPDTILLDHRVRASNIEPGSKDRIHKISFGWTFINADGVVKVGYLSQTSQIPEDMIQADIDGLYADFDDHAYSAKTVRATVRAGLLSGFLT